MVNNNYNYYIRCSEFSNHVQAMVKIHKLILYAACVWRHNDRTGPSHPAGAMFGPSTAGGDRIGPASGIDLLGGIHEANATAQPLPARHRHGTAQDLCAGGRHDPDLHQRRVRLSVPIHLRRFLLAGASARRQRAKGMADDLMLMDKGRVGRLQNPLA